MRSLFFCVFFVSIPATAMYQQEYMVVQNKTRDVHIQVQSWYCDPGFTNTPQVQRKDVLPKSQESVLVEKLSNGLFSLLIMIKKNGGQFLFRRLQLDNEQGFLAICRKQNEIHVEDYFGMVCIIDLGR